MCAVNLGPLDFPSQGQHARIRKAEDVQIKWSSSLSFIHYQALSNIPSILDRMSSQLKGNVKGDMTGRDSIRSEYIMNELNSFMM